MIRQTRSCLGGMTLIPSRAAAFALAAALTILSVSLMPGLAAAKAAGAPGPASPQAGLTFGGEQGELVISSVSPQTVRIRLAPVSEPPPPDPWDQDLVLVQQTWPGEDRLRTLSGTITFKPGKLRVSVSSDPFTIEVKRADGSTVQRLTLDSAAAKMTFLLGDGPVYGLGAGGPQYDRRGSTYDMRNSHGAYQLATHGGRLPIPWLVGASGWAMFVHAPLGSFDLTGSEGRFEKWEREAALPLDVFVVGAKEPAEIMTEYARITGFPHMPPIWTLGYQQSHRTLASREEIMGVAKTMREKKLPCDVLIYLGTGWCPSGWNTGHASFTWNSTVFPDPEKMIQEMHDMDYKVILHVVFPPRHLYGSARDKDVDTNDANHAANYWAKHLEVHRLGVDGWWPDAAENLGTNSRLARNRMYWEGPQTEKPNLRAYGLHRTGYAGIQRYGWFWSGDVQSTWETLQVHLPLALNTSLSGIPYWGTDIAGFYPTPEFTAEFYVRWFQYMAFSPLFRSHGRAWKLRLPWGWNTGEVGPIEGNPDVRNYAVPDPSELHNPEVEPICKKFMETRYRLMPYIYTLVRETHETGIPMMRSLWIHYSDDPKAVERSDEYLWGRDMLVAPVVEKGAASRRLYLPRGQWYDFWTEEKASGGREVSREVDLSMMPVYVRAGAIIPMGPVKQYTTEAVDGPLSIVVYPGADGAFAMYDDDGLTFDFEDGEWSKLHMNWNDSRRTLSLRQENGSSSVSQMSQKIEVRLAGEKTVRTVDFTGAPVEVKF